MDKNLWIEEMEKITNTFNVESPQLFYDLNNYATKNDNGKLRSIALDLQHYILECLNVCIDITSEIRVSENEYTLHGLQHSFNVIDLMGQLISRNYNISVLEIGFLVYSALLHDVGMMKIGNEKISSEQIRNKHGIRSADFIRKNIIKTASNQELSFGKYDFYFRTYLPELCQSHMEDLAYILNFPRNLLVDSCKIDLFFCAILLRLADAMDMRNNRAPYSLFCLLDLNDISAFHWKKHMSISNCMIDQDGYFRIDGICDDAKILRAILQHIELVEKELKTILIEFSYKENDYPLSIRTEIIRNKIITKGYKVWNNTIRLDYYSITNLFMGSQLYGSNKAGLREIMQNAIDACLVRKSIIEKNSNIQTYIPQISITFDEDYIYITDNGIGMTLEIIEKYFLNVGVSYYRTTEFISEKLSYKPVGYFGIGFLACFMLSDDILVKTANYNDATEYTLHFIKGDKYVIIYKKQKTDFVGTNIRFKKEKFLSEFKYLHEIDSNEYEKGNIEKYINYSFWNLVLTKKNDNYIYNITNKTFFEFSKGLYEMDSEYLLKVDNYLNGVEGAIFLKDDIGLQNMWKDSGVKLSNFVNALIEGLIEINGKITRTIPFGDKSYVFVNQNLRKINKNDNFIYEDNYVLGFISFKYDKTFSPDFPLFIPRDMFDNVIITNKIYAYNRMFGSTDLELLKKDINYKLLEHLGKKYDNIYFLLPNSKSPYLALLNEKIEAENDRKIIELYLKSTRINAFDIEKNWFLFDIKKIMLNVTNEKILPQASRSDLVEKSEVYIKNALEIVKYLWLIDQFYGNHKSKNTIKYLKKKVLTIWDDCNPLLKNNLKPI